MKRSLSFRCRTECVTSGQTIDVLAVFFSRTDLDISVVDDALQDALKTQEPLPDAVVLLSFGEHSEKLIKVWQSSPMRVAGLTQRGRTSAVNYLKELSIWTFRDGAFERVHRDPESRADYKLNVSQLVRKGLADLVEQHGAFQEAPPGHVFQHPSKRQTTYFLLASELLKDETDAYFVALVICVAAWGRLKHVSTIHIDTMGIYPVARAMEDIVTTSGGSEGRAWEIDSFHSHGGVSGLHSIVGAHEAILISASTSGAMAKRLVEAKVENDSVITILDISDENRSGTVVYARERYVKSTSPVTPTAQSGAVIELTGEYFAARGKKPRSVTLALEHKRTELETLLAEFSHADACSLNKKRATGAAVIDLVSLSEDAIAASKNFRAWVTEEVRLKTPVSVTDVIYLGGAGGKSIASLAARKIKACTGRQPRVVSASQLQSLTPSSTRGVLVCAPIVGNGHALRSLARDLREIVPEASRHFVVGIALPSTSEAWRRLDQFLTQSGKKNRPYQLSHWVVLPTGAEPGQGAAWLRAAKLMQQTESMNFIPGSAWNEDVVRKSLKLAGNALEAASRGFLPTPLGRPLKLTRGFVYWAPKKGALDTCDHAAASFVSMASAMQHAREFAKHLNKLASSIHETVVLDPENFLRFNDGVLQSSLLRAAQAHELDYSGTSELSEMMREFLEKVFINHARGYGEAATEFAFALASGHLKLTDKDRDLLLKQISISISEASALLGLLYCWWLKSQIVVGVQKSSALSL